MKKNKPGQGRKPSPTALKLLTNQRLKKYPETEAQPVRKLPPVPKHLTPEARKVWRTLGKKLLGYGLLTETDGAVFGMLCTVIADMATIEELRQEKDFVYITDKGNRTPEPLVWIAKSLRSEALALAREFGMTPASRSGIKIDLPGEKNPYRELQKRRAEKRANDKADTN